MGTFGSLEVMRDWERIKRFIRRAYEGLSDGNQSAIGLDDICVDILPPAQEGNIQRDGNGSVDRVAGKITLSLPKDHTDADQVLDFYLSLFHHIGHLATPDRDVYRQTIVDRLGPLPEDEIQAARVRMVSSAMAEGREQGKMAVAAMYFARNAEEAKADMFAWVLGRRMKPDDTSMWDRLNVERQELALWSTYLSSIRGQYISWGVLSDSRFCPEEAYTRLSVDPLSKICEAVVRRFDEVSCTPEGGLFYARQVMKLSLDDPHYGLSVRRQVDNMAGSFEEDKGLDFRTSRDMVYETLGDQYVRPIAGIDLDNGPPGLMYLEKERVYA